MTVATGRWLVVLHGSTTEEPRLPKISPVIDRDSDDDYESMMMMMVTMMTMMTMIIMINNDDDDGHYEAAVGIY